MHRVQQIAAIAHDVCQFVAGDLIACCDEGLDRSYKFAERAVQCAAVGEAPSHVGREPDCLCLGGEREHGCTEFLLDDGCGVRMHE